MTLRFIERMPFTEEDGFCSYLPADRLIAELGTRGELARNTTIDTNVAMMYEYRYRGRFPIRIGVIPAISKKFCSSCNRLRITSDGYFKTCLHSSQEYDLKGLMRSGADDRSLHDFIVAALSEKNGEHNLDCRPEGGGCAALTTEPHDVEDRRLIVMEPHPADREITVMRKICIIGSGCRRLRRGHGAARRRPCAPWRREPLRSHGNSHRVERDSEPYTERGPGHQRGPARTGMRSASFTER